MIRAVAPRRPQREKTKLSVQGEKKTLMIEIKNILFPCDLRETSSMLFPYVISLSKKYDSMISLIHVINDISRWGVLYIPHIPLDLYQKEAEQAAEKLMDKICAEKLKGRSNVRKKVVSGDPASEILKTIEVENIDLVVMATHGLNGLERRTVGNVTEKVVKESAAPVLVINPFKIK
jgi:nucleotide-binding universal stress UspA family protein